MDKNEMDNKNKSSEVEIDEEEAIEKTLEKALGLGASYALAYITSSATTSFSVRDSIVEDILTGYNIGFSIRVLAGGNWGFSSTNKTERIEDIFATVEYAVRAARAASKYSMRKWIRRGSIVSSHSCVNSRNVVKNDKIQLSEERRERHLFDIGVEKKAEVPLETKLSFVQDIDRAVQSQKKGKRIEHCPAPAECNMDPFFKDHLVYDNIISGKAKGKVVSTNISYQDTLGHFLAGDTEGALIGRGGAFFSLTLSSTAADGAHGIFQTFENFHARNDFSRFYKMNIPAKAEFTAYRARVLLGAKQPEKGSFRVLLHPAVAGTLVHEVIGHSAEADSVQAKDSYFAGRVGTEIASPEITIVDDATLKGKFGTYSYDSDLVRSNKTVIIDKGVLKNILHSRETAYRAGIHSTGNSRAQSYEYLPTVRMSNTYLAAGDWGLDEMMDDRKIRYVMIGSGGGEVNTLGGEFTFGCEYAFKLRKGEVVEVV
ncbi:MAG: TldD/PmbA family protein, partial [Thermoplasmata archaeon]